MKKYYIESLGCSKNLVDSEIIAHIVDSADYRKTDDPAEAHLIIVNTCGFINPAKEEGVDTILAMAELKKQGNCEILIATGCLVKRYSDDLKESIPELDHLVDLKDFEQFNKLFNTNSQWERDLLTPKHYAYLRISDGCNNHCSYCAIPGIRGGLKSVPMEDLISEAEKLAEKGVKELIITAQDTANYGTDLYGEQKLPVLIRKLAKLNLFPWIRLLYIHPAHINSELIDTMKEIPEVLNYFEIPLQHINNRILKDMNRRISKQRIIDIINEIRNKVPNAVIRTTFIVGYPNETEEEYLELRDFIEEFNFERLGVFAYSREEDTKAFELEDNVEEDVKQFRRDEIMALQQHISKNFLEKYVDKKMEIIIDEKSQENQFSWLGRSYFDSPEIDGMVFLTHTDLDINPGDFVEVRIIDSTEYDLVGEIIKKL